ncbi:MAG: hypothetical protein SGPRY_008050, partial [Prymnesium sp.]
MEPRLPYTPHPSSSHAKQLTRHAQSRSLYDMGRDITLCWATPEGGLPSRVDCQGAYVEFLSEWPASLYSDQLYSIDFMMHVPPALHPIPSIEHANLHTCLRNFVFCSPFVDATNSLATHGPELKGSLNAAGYASFTQKLRNEVGSYTVIAHARWQNEGGVVFNMARAHVVDVLAPRVNNSSIVVVVVLSAVMGLALLIGAWLAFIKQHKHAAAAAKRLDRENKRRVMEAVQQVQTARYPMCVIKFDTFRTFDSVKRHEFCREEGHLVTLDTWEEICEFASKNRILFISHQWLGFDEPDPNREHYHAIMKVRAGFSSVCASFVINQECVPQAADALCSLKSIDPSMLFIWIDYMSMPQKCKATAKCAISSLCVYTAASKFFIVCTPPAWHVDRKVQSGSPFLFLPLPMVSAPQEPVDGNTYLKRGWCRFEQWARLTTGGIHVRGVIGVPSPARIPTILTPPQDMYVFREELEEIAKDEFRPWVAESINVFQGEFQYNREEDKRELVNLVLGLWSLAHQPHALANTRQLIDQ